MAVSQCRAKRESESCVIDRGAVCYRQESCVLLPKELYELPGELHGIIDGMLYAYDQFVALLLGTIQHCITLPSHALLNSRKFHFFSV